MQYLGLLTCHHLWTRKGGGGEPCVESRGATRNELCLTRGIWLIHWDKRQGPTLCCLSLSYQCLPLAEPHEKPEAQGNHCCRLTAFQAQRAEEERVEKGGEWVWSGKQKIHSTRPTKRLKSSGNLLSPGELEHHLSHWMGKIPNFVNCKLKYGLIENIYSLFPRVDFHTIQPVPRSRKSDSVAGNHSPAGWL